MHVVCMSVIMAPTLNDSVYLFLKGKTSKQTALQLEAFKQLLSFNANQWLDNCWIEEAHPATVFNLRAATCLLLATKMWELKHSSRNLKKFNLKSYRNDYKTIVSIHENIKLDLLIIVLRHPDKLLPILFQLVLTGFNSDRVLLPFLSLHCSVSQPEP